VPAARVMRYPRSDAVVGEPRTTAPNAVASACTTRTDRHRRAGVAVVRAVKFGGSGDAERCCWFDGTGSMGVEDRGDRFDSVDESRTWTHDEGVGVESPHLCVLGQ
jgi:hypothetical protein